jgi:hypothetical protein
MTVDRAVMMFAGAMVLLSVALTRWVHPGWMWLTVFVGANLVQASITGFCPIARVFRRLGLRSGETPARQAAWPDSDVPPQA